MIDSDWPPAVRREIESTGATGREPPRCDSRDMPAGCSPSRPSSTAVGTWPSGGPPCLPTSARGSRSGAARSTPTSPKNSAPAPRVPARRSATDFFRFCDHWGLVGMASWDLPDPQGALFPNLLPPGAPALPRQGLHLYLPIHYPLTGDDELLAPDPPGAAMPGRRRRAPSLRGRAPPLQGVRHHPRSPPLGAGHHGCASAPARRPPGFVGLIKEAIAEELYLSVDQVDKWRRAISACRRGRRDSHPAAQDQDLIVDVVRLLDRPSGHLPRGRRGRRPGMRSRFPRSGTANPSPLTVIIEFDTGHLADTRSAGWPALGPCLTARPHMEVPREGQHHDNAPAPPVSALAPQAQRIRAPRPVRPRDRSARRRVPRPPAPRAGPDRRRHLRPLQLAVPGLDRRSGPDALRGRPRPSGSSSRASSSSSTRPSAAPRTAGPASIGSGPSWPRKAVDVLLVFSTNRLSRKIYKAMQFVEEEVVERGIRCLFVKSGVDTADAEPLADAAAGPCHDRRDRRRDVRREHPRRPRGALRRRAGLRARSRSATAAASSPTSSPGDSGPAAPSRSIPRPPPGSSGPSAGTPRIACRSARSSAASTTIRRSPAARAGATAAGRTRRSATCSPTPGIAAGGSTGPARTSSRARRTTPAGSRATSRSDPPSSRTLRIVPDELWYRAQRRLTRADRSGVGRKPRGGDPAIAPPADSRPLRLPRPTTRSSTSAAASDATCTARPVGSCLPAKRPLYLAPAPRSWP